MTPEEIEKSVEKYVKECKAELLEKRYRYNVGLIMQKVRNELPWADGKAVKNEVDVQVNNATCLIRAFYGKIVIC